MKRAAYQSRSLTFIQESPISDDRWGLAFEVHTNGVLSAGCHLSVCAVNALDARGLAARILAKFAATGCIPSLPEMNPAAVVESQPISDIRTLRTLTGMSLPLCYAAYAQRNAMLYQGDAVLALAHLAEEANGDGRGGQARLDDAMLQAAAWRSANIALDERFPMAA